jgi:hypothetical protein
VFVGKKQVTTKLSEVQSVLYIGAWHPDGNISLSELEEPEPDEPGHGAVNYTNNLNDCDDNVEVSGTVCNARWKRKLTSVMSRDHWE